ncbi:tripartite tricarboxylate transporter TctB family protein [uncultured Desulfuromusa sp.]|uniref:tripartite tricarboxylate transporter TctB family protein n=1 Tax=uncultured Desulfuromusa sp. TaxID=219183 RepID=UPI002AA96057|nr:tripartite tricarboxylate transporter TctB family protein [uncultured Desulfuromusa sp.]
MESQETKGLIEVVVAGICALIGLLLIFYVIPRQVMDSGEPIPNARTFPYVIASFFALLSGVWAIIACRGWLKTRAKADFSPLFLGLSMSACVVVIAMLIDWSGYLLGGLVATFLVFVAIEGKGKWLRAAVFSAVMVVAYALFFENVLNIEVPAGFLSFSSVLG